MKNRISIGFDFLAPFYDGLARFIIGNDIITAQLHFLTSFKHCRRILILGGGSGWLLNYLCTAYPDLEIDYIDVSAKMLGIAKRRVENNKRINFIRGTENNIPDKRYHGVITNFYLDMFDENSLKEVMQKIKRSLSDKAIWVVTDFVNQRATHAIRLWFMYRFFRIMAGIEARHLADWQSEMRRAEFGLLESKKFRSCIFRTY